MGGGHPATSNTSALSLCSSRDLPPLVPTPHRKRIARLYSVGCCKAPSGRTGAGDKKGPWGGRGPRCRHAQGARFPCLVGGGQHGGRVSSSRGLNRGTPAAIIGGSTTKKLTLNGAACRATSGNPIVFPPQHGGEVHAEMVSHFAPRPSAGLTQLANVDCLHGRQYALSTSQRQVEMHIANVQCANHGYR